MDRLMGSHSLGAMRTLLSSGLNRRTHAIFASVGDDSVHSQWLSDEGFLARERSFDLILVYYGESAKKYREYQRQCDLSACHKGSKLQNLRWANRRWPDLFESYQAVWSLDDDINIGPAGIENCFRLLHHYDLWMAQPAYTHDSQISHPLIQKQRAGHLLRYTTFVECSLPLMSSTAWKMLREPVLEHPLVEWVTGAGVDLAYWHILGKPVDKMAVFDCVTCHHPRRPSEMQRVFGPTLPLQEAWAATLLFGVPTSARNADCAWPAMTYESLRSIPLPRHECDG